MPGVSKEQIEWAKQVDILDYLLAHEPNNLQKTGNEYRLRDHDSLTISNGKWHWHSRGFGGKTATALNFLIKVRELSFVDAVQTLAYEARAGPLPEVKIAAAKTPKSKVKKPFALPAKNNNNDRAIAYLMGRGIDRDIIRFCIEAGTLYETKKYHSCAFIGRDTGGKARFVCVRGTTSGFRQDIDGSDKRFGFCLPALTPPGNTVTVAEAPIDALSMATLQKLQSPDWGGCHYLSLSGTSPLALLQYLKDNPQINHVILGLDNDKAGEKGYDKVREAVFTDETLAGRTINVSYHLPPMGKDYNETLLATLGENKHTCRPDRAANLL